MWSGRVGGRKPTWLERSNQKIKMWMECNLKKNVRCFLWMKTTNCNSNLGLNCWQQCALSVSKNLLLICFCFCYVLLLCKLWQRELGELIFEMECNFSCSMKTLHEFCGSCFYKEIGSMILGKWGDEVMRSIFDASWRSEGMLYRWWKKKKLLDFLEHWKLCVGFGFWVL
jgi:hypothetical protein